MPMSKKNKTWKIGDQITESTKIRDLSDFLAYLKDTTIRELKTAAERKYGDPWGITIGQMLDGLRGKFFVLENTALEDVTVIQHFWIVSYRDMMEQLCKTLEKLTPPCTPEAKQAQTACIDMSFDEGILIFLRSYFGLRTFDDAMNLHISDLLLARKDVYNRAAFEQALSRITANKYKK